MSFTYVDPANENLVCCICRAPFVDPYTTRTCCHTFCCECIVTALSVSRQCPIDRSPLTTDDLSPADPLVRNLVDELLVECPNSSSGCEHTCQRQLVDLHLRESCQYVSVPCPSHKCDKIILKRDIPQHTHNDSTICETCRKGVESTTIKSHLDSCGGALITCSACLSELPRREFALHESSCADVVIPCSHNSMGCSWTGRRGTLKDIHLPVCTYESLKGFFSIYKEREEALNQENLRLRQKVDALEGVVNVTRRELAVAQEALGPWYRSAQTRVNAPPQTGSGPSSTVHTPDISGPRSSHFLSGVSSDIVSPPPPVHFNGPAELLASYFPEQIDHLVPFEYQTIGEQHVMPAASTPHTLTPLQRVPPIRPPPVPSTSYIHIPPAISASSSSSSITTTPITTPAGHHPHAHHHHTSSVATNISTSTSAVAPLNLSTTLEGSLSGLRESVVTLSAALDSLSRQHEVAITTEAMRTNEEIRSLRAVVHGLRMQVHSMMVDRNAQVTGRHLELPTPAQGLGVGRNVSVGASRSSSGGHGHGENHSTNESREGPPSHPPWLPNYPLRFPMVPSSIPITKL